MEHKQQPTRSGPDIQGLRFAAILAVLATTLAPAAASGAKRDIRGIALEMPASSILALKSVACHVNKSGDTNCLDPIDGSEYKILLNGAHPSLAVSVKHTFCSTAAPDAVLSNLMKEYHVPKIKARSNPNGYDFEIAGTVEGNLNSNDGNCKAGGKEYQFSIRDDSLMHM